MMDLVYAICGYFLLLLICFICEWIRKYLFEQEKKRKAGIIKGYSWQEIVVYGFLMLLSVLTLGFAAMLFLSNGVANEKSVE